MEKNGDLFRLTADNTGISVGPLGLYYDASPSLSTLKLSDLSKQSRAEGINDATGQSDRKWAEYGGCRWPWQTGHSEGVY